VASVGVWVFVAGTDLEFAKRPAENVVHILRPFGDLAIAASIKEWGWTTPALVGEDGGLTAGHSRILAARQLGIAEIPVMVAAGWPLDEPPQK
jgi:hypothetical protein